METKTYTQEEVDRNFVLKPKAFSYALRTELEALKDMKINEDEFSEFIDNKIYDIDESLEEAWDEWREEKEEQEDN